mgnify:CR=1 FL=1
MISLSWLANIYVLPVAIGTDPWSNVKIVRPGTSEALDLGSVIIDCEDKHYNTVDGKGIPECWLKTRRQLPA